MKCPSSCLFYQHRSPLLKGKFKDWFLYFLLFRCTTNTRLRFRHINAVCGSGWRSVLLVIKINVVLLSKCHVNKIYSPFLWCHLDILHFLLYLLLHTLCLLDGIAFALTKPKYRYRAKPVHMSDSAFRASHQNIPAFFDSSVIEIPKFPIQFLQLWTSFLGQASCFFQFLGFPCAQQSEFEAMNHVSSWQGMLTSRHNLASYTSVKMLIAIVPWPSIFPPTSLHIKGPFNSFLDFQLNLSIRWSLSIKCEKVADSNSHLLEILRCINQYSIE